MHRRGASDKDPLYLSFNQDYSCLSVGTVDGIMIFNCDPFSRCYSQNEGGYGIVEMLFCTSLVALVGAGEQPAYSPRRLQLVNTKTQQVICELNFASAVLAVRLNRKRLVAVLNTQIHIYDLSSMKLLHTLDTPPNPRGACALSPNDDNCYLAYPTGSGTSGEVCLFDALNLQTLNVISAHKSPVVTMTFNYTGTMLATASDKGTVIRVFSIPQSNKSYTFRRGSYAATIHSLSINMSSTLLCASSDTGTIHVFRLGDDPPPSATSTLVSSYLPDSINDLWEPARDFAVARLPVTSIPSICAIHGGNSAQLMVVTANGYFYQYALDPVAGGECKLEKEYRLMETESEQVSTKFV